MKRTGLYCATLALALLASAGCRPAQGGAPGQPDPFPDSMPLEWLGLHDPDSWGMDQFRGERHFLYMIDSIPDVELGFRKAGVVWEFYHISTPTEDTITHPLQSCKETKLGYECLIDFEGRQDKVVVQWLDRAKGTATFHYPPTHEIRGAVIDERRHWQELPIYNSLDTGDAAPE